MGQAAEATDRDILDLILGPATSPQTYLNLLYLLLAFPLGIIYFIFLITALSLGAGLIVIYIGIPILFAALVACWGLGAFERQLAQSMLRVKIPGAPLPPGPGFWRKLKAVFTDTMTWKSLTYLLLKFPFGIAVFTVLVTAFSISISLILAPLLYRTIPIDFYFWQVDTRDEATIWCLVGVVLLIVSMHLVNGLAMVWGRFARIMLAPDSPVGR